MRFALDISLDNIEVFNKSKSCLFSFLIKLLSLVVCLLLLHPAVFSQQDTAHQVTAQQDTAQQDSAHQKPVDSLKINYDSSINKVFSSIKQFGANEQRKNINEYKEG